MPNKYVCSEKYLYQIFSDRFFTFGFFYNVVSVPHTKIMKLLIEIKNTPLWYSIHTNETTTIYEEDKKKVGTNIQTYLWTHLALVFSRLRSTVLHTAHFASVDGLWNHQQSGTSAADTRTRTTRFSGEKSTGSHVVVFHTWKNGIYGRLELLLLFYEKFYKYRLNSKEVTCCRVHINTDEEERFVCVFVCIE